MPAFPTSIGQTEASQIDALVELFPVFAEIQIWWRFNKTEAIQAMDESDFVPEDRPDLW